MNPHLIRLRGPWQWRPLTRTRLLTDGQTCDEPGSLPGGGDARPPFDWAVLVGGEFRGRIELTRRFGRPTGLHQRQRVSLRFGPLDAYGCAELNGELLGRLGQEPRQFEVGEILQPRNNLRVVIELPRCPEGGDESFTLTGLGLLGEVALAIDETP